jgi:hypothetical protein
VENKTGAVGSGVHHALHCDCDCDAADRDCSISLAAEQAPATLGSRKKSNQFEFAGTCRLPVSKGWLLDHGDKIDLVHLLIQGLDSSRLKWAFRYTVVAFKIWG